MHEVESIIWSEDQDEFPNFLVSEVVNALKTVKAGKSTGPDGVDNLTLKTFADEIAPTPVKFFNKILETETTP